MVGGSPTRQLLAHLVETQRSTLADICIRLGDLCGMLRIVKQRQCLLKRFEIVDTEHDDCGPAVTSDRDGIMGGVDRLDQLRKPVFRLTHGNCLHTRILADIAAENIADNRAEKSYAARSR